MSPQGTISSIPIERRRLATLVALTLVTAAEYWTSSGVSLVLADLTGTLSASSDEASWTLTAYTTAFAVSVVFSHRLSIHFGNRRYLAFCALLYALASIGCASSMELGIFLLFRVLQGFAGGTFLVRAFVFLAHQYDQKSRGVALTLYGLIFFFIGKSLAPLLCGWITDALSWRWIFLGPVLLTLPAAILFYRYTLDSWIDEKERQRVDWRGMLLLTLGACALQTVLSRGETDDWLGSHRIEILLILGVLGNLAFALWQLASANKEPLLNLELLYSRAGYSSAIVGFAIGILLAGSLYVVPQYLRSLESHSATQAGILLSVGGAASVLVLCVFKWVSAVVMRFGPKAVLTVGLIVEIISQLMFAHYFTPDTPDHYLWLPLALNGIFIALTVPTVGTAIFAMVDDIHIAPGRSLYYGARQLGASVGVTLATIIVDHRMTLHSSRLLDAVFSSNRSILGVAADPTSALAAASLSAMVKRQAAVLSYADVFFVMTIIAVLTLFLIPLLPPFPSQKTQAVAQPSFPTSGVQLTAEPGSAL